MGGKSTHPGVVAALIGLGWIAMPNPDQISIACVWVWWGLNTNGFRSNSAGIQLISKNRSAVHRNLTTAEENKTLIRRLKEEVINDRDPSAADRFFATGFSTLNPIPGREPGIQGLKRALKEFFVAFPDVHETIKELVVEGDKVAVMGTIHATHRGEFMGIPATGRSVTFAINEIYAIREGKIQTGWVYVDLFTLVNQLRP